MRPFLAAGRPATAAATLEVRDPYRGEVVDEVALASWDEVDAALEEAVRAFEVTRRQSAGERARVLLGAAARITERSEDLARLIVREGGKPLKGARAEVARAISTLTWAGEEAKRFTGELVRLDHDEATRGRLGLVRRFPIGVVLGITPFNFPLNLVCHKAGPALAVGSPIVVKPAPATPLSALALGDILVEAGGGAAVSVLPCPNEVAERAVVDPRVAVFSFTGSSDVGWRLKSLVPRKRVTLELGGNAAVVVEPDANLEYAAERVAYGGFYQAGQSCISVQRVYVERTVFRRFTDELVPRVEALVVGDPADEATDVGPLINRAALDRVQAWVRQALDGGAQALCGAKRDDPFYFPTVLTGTRAEMDVCRREVFGPVVVVEPYEDFDQALDLVNASEYGLQAGIFTSDVRKVFRAHRELVVGGVIVDDVSSFRADPMPYGGVKASGYGREGVRYAMDEMTETRVLVLSWLDL